MFSPLLIFFDLDGTLIDSKADIVNAVNFGLAEQGFPQLPSKTIADYVGWGLTQLIKDCLGSAADLEKIKRVKDSFWKYYDTHCLDETQLYPQVEEILIKLSKHPKAVVTNKPYYFSKKILEELNIAHHFKWLIGGDSLPDQKPSPKVLEFIFKDFDQKPKSLIVGDSAIDIECGKAAGILTCGVSYGFRPPEELITAHADYVIDTIAELEKLDCF